MTKETIFKFISKNEAVRKAGMQIFDIVHHFSLSGTLKYKKNVVTLCFPLPLSPEDTFKVEFFRICIEQTNQLKGSYRRNGEYFMVVGVNRDYWSDLRKLKENEQLQTL